MKVVLILYYITLVFSLEYNIFLFRIPKDLFAFVPKGRLAFTAT